MCLRPEATAKILEAEEIDLPGKSTCSHFYHLTSDVGDRKRKYRWSRNTCQIRKMCLSDFYDPVLWIIQSSLSLSLTLSFYALFLNHRFYFTLARASDSAAPANWQNFINGSRSYAQLILLGFFPFRSSANRYCKFFRDVTK